MADNALLEKLKNEEELYPFDHDGSYEIVQTTVEMYAERGRFDDLDYSDLDLIYLMAVGTFKDGLESKKTRVRKSRLSDAQKNRLLDVLDNVWDKACLKQYNNTEYSKDKIFFGMFGSGFFTFKKFESEEWTKQIREVIKMFVDIRKLTDDEEIFDIAENILKQPIKGLQAASVSIILHCLKPDTFPILNGNEGMGDIFDALGIDLLYKKSAQTYIENCRKIKKFRDENVDFKNYRVFDLLARQVSSEIKKDLWPSKDEYPYFLTKEQWIEFINVDRVNYPSTLKMLTYMNNNGKEASCKHLADALGGKPSAYISRGSNFAKRAKEKYNMPACLDENGKEYFFPIAFLGHKVKPDEESEVYSWVLREELSEALDEIDYEEEETVVKVEFDHNIILYGPPGTGKTYNSARYAVAICDEIPIEEVNAWDYSDVLARYNELKAAERIAFTTFHQSYGYEEFIEGIRPLMEEENTESSGDIKYEIKAGAFKEFCDKALKPIIKNDDIKLPVNSNPTIWKVSLKGTGDNEIRRECLDNNHIRIGWDEYGETISDDTEYTRGGKAVLNAFYNKMKVGDIVISCYSSELTDAIGVVTGEAQWEDRYSSYKRFRNVDWIVKGIQENILKLNNDKPMTLSSIYKMDMDVRSVIDIIKKYDSSVVSEEKPKNCVFVIDEINRGNISKIFGELITLIEDTKRIGAKEEMRAILPYSRKPFGVPNNVYILGTMNTADRSIAIMDTALRRRFRFIEMMPDVNVLDGIIVSDGSVSVNVSEMLSVINERIDCLFDREHTIGHAFFVGLKDKPTVEALGNIFRKSVIPLLQEYFYDDYEKIRLVLGDNGKNESIQFIKNKGFKASLFKPGKSDELPDEKDQFEINEEAFDNILSYKEII